MDKDAGGFDKEHSDSFTITPTPQANGGVPAKVTLVI